MEKLSVIILAGGNSSRFGTPKPFLPFDKNFNFLEKIVNVYTEFGCKEILLVLNKEHLEIFRNNLPDTFKSKLKVTYNDKPSLGRFYSLKLGADSICGHDFCFMQNIDNPFTESGTLQKLFDNRKEDAFVSPVYSGKGGHPVLLPRNIIEAIKKETDMNLNIKDFLGRFNRIKAEVETKTILVNINTPDDYEMFFKNPK